MFVVPFLLAEHVLQESLTIVHEAAEQFHVLELLISLRHEPCFAQL